jgi:hypothetical protein
MRGGPAVLNYSMSKTVSFCSVLAVLVWVGACQVGYFCSGPTFWDCWNNEAIFYGGRPLGAAKPPTQNTRSTPTLTGTWNKASSANLQDRKEQYKFRLSLAGPAASTMSSNCEIYCGI